MKINDLSANNLNEASGWSDDDKLDENKLDLSDPALVHNTDTEIDQKDLYSLVNKYRKMLPAKTAEIIDMRSRGYTFNEIADELNLSKSYVNTEYRIGIYKLKLAILSNAPDDIKRFYGYKGEIPTSKYQPYSTNIHHLWNQVKNDPSMKIVRTGATAFLTVPVDDPRPEVIYDPLSDEQKVELKKKLMKLKSDVSRLERIAVDNDNRRKFRNGDKKYHQKLLKNDPRYQQLLNKIEQLSQRLSKTWYVKSDNR